MADELSVFLRDNTHTSASVRLALKADQLALSFSRTPIHIALPRSNPEIFDLGTTRPAITISGLVDNIGLDTTNTSAATAFKGMQIVSHTIGGNTEIYYVPYKNYLENKLITWVTSDSTDLQLEIGDATTPENTSSLLSTGGGVYRVAVQQFQFSQTPGLEDRWAFSISFVAKFREGVSF
tara:strand:- start:236 stop:775 length:540 start_codon:yes stop_codon:yes gene_type:complete